jgi:hypothetical protein
VGGRLDGGAQNRALGPNLSASPHNGNNPTNASPAQENIQHQDGKIVLMAASAGNVRRQKSQHNRKKSRQAYKHAAGIGVCRRELAAKRKTIDTGYNYRKYQDAGTLAPRRHSPSLLTCDESFSVSSVMAFSNVAHPSRHA